MKTTKGGPKADYVLTTRGGAKPSADREAKSAEVQDEALAYDSRIAASTHEGMEGLAALGLVEKTTIAEFDASCLVPVAQLDAPDIKALRRRERVSQSVLAKYLGVAVVTVGQWERGVRKPDGPVLKLLSLIDRHGLDYIR